MEISARDVAIYAGLATLAGTGWNLFLSSKLSSLRALWKWKDDFVDEYGEYKISVVKEFATKSEVAAAVEKIDNHIDSLRRSIDRLRDFLERNNRENG